MEYVSFAYTYENKMYYYYSKCHVIICVFYACSKVYICLVGMKIEIRIFYRCTFANVEGLQCIMNKLDSFSTIPKFRILYKMSQ